MYLGVNGLFLLESLGAMLVNYDCARHALLVTRHEEAECCKGKYPVAFTINPFKFHFFSIL